MSLLDRYAPEDRELVARICHHLDPAEAERRQRLFSGSAADFDDTTEADKAMSELLGSAKCGFAQVGRIVDASRIWGTDRDWVSAPATHANAVRVAPQQRKSAEAVKRIPPPAPVAPVPGAVPPVTREQREAVMPASSAALTATPCTARAVEFLQTVLAKGEMKAVDVLAVADKSALTAKMLRVARERLKVVSERRGFGSGAFWRLPSEPIGAHIRAYSGPVHEQVNRKAKP